jgi:NAD(P)H-hydrate epimerase
MNAATIGAWLHGAAADKVAAQQGERGMLASDVLAVLPSVLNSPEAVLPYGVESC